MPNPAGEDYMVNAEADFVRPEESDFRYHFWRAKRIDRIRESTPGKYVP